MREHKYQAWHKVEQKMYEVSVIHFGVQYGISPSDSANLVLLCDKSQYYREGQEVDLIEYTGLKDKTGKDIYEGDIVLHHAHNLKCIVKWCDGKKELLGSQVGWMYDNGYYIIEFEATTKYPSEPKEDYADVTVLGNIYEHPDLLKDMGSFGYDPITRVQKRNSTW